MDERDAIREATEAAIDDAVPAARTDDDIVVEEHDVVAARRSIAIAIQCPHGATGRPYRGLDIETGNGYFRIPRFVIIDDEYDFQPFRIPGRGEYAFEHGAKLLRSAAGWHDQRERRRGHGIYHFCIQTTLPVRKTESGGTP